MAGPANQCDAAALVIRNLNWARACFQRTSSAKAKSAYPKWVMAITAPLPGTGVRDGPVRGSASGRLDSPLTSTFTWKIHRSSSPARTINR